MLQSAAVILGWIGPYRIPVRIHTVPIALLPCYSSPNPPNPRVPLRSTSFLQVFIIITPLSALYLLLSATSQLILWVIACIQSSGLKAVAVAMVCVDPFTAFPACVGWKRPTTRIVFTPCWMYRCGVSTSSENFVVHLNAHGASECRLTGGSLRPKSAHEGSPRSTDE